MSKKRQRRTGGADRRRRYAAVYKRDKNVCRKCGSGSNLTIDHIVPLAHGGSNKITNLQVLCFTCNQTKADGRERRFG